MYIEIGSWFFGFNPFGISFPWDAMVVLFCHQKNSHRLDSSEVACLALIPKDFQPS